MRPMTPPADVPLAAITDRPTDRPTWRTSKRVAAARIAADGQPTEIGPAAPEVADIRQS